MVPFFPDSVGEDDKPKGVTAAQRQREREEKRKKKQKSAERRRKEKLKKGSKLLKITLRMLNIGIPIKKIYCNWATAWQTNKMTSAPSEASDQPGHPPSLIWVFAVRMKQPWVLSYPLSAQQRLWRGGCPSWSESLLVHMSFCWFCRVQTQWFLNFYQLGVTIQ